MVTKSHLTSGDITEEIGRFANISTFDELFLGTCEDYVEFKVFIEWIFEKNLSMEVQKTKKLAESSDNDNILI